MGTATILFDSYLIKVEPYWNVNVVLQGIQPFENIIKVEPYWNVNLIDSNIQMCCC